MADLRHYYKMGREEYLDSTEPEIYGLERELSRIKQEGAMAALSLMVGAKGKTGR
jgi:hypothetical protein